MLQRSPDLAHAAEGLCPGRPGAIQSCPPPGSTLNDAPEAALNLYGDWLLEKRGIALANLGDRAIASQTPLGRPRTTSRRDSLRADSLYHEATSAFLEALRRYRNREPERLQETDLAEIYLYSAYPLSVTGEEQEAYCRLDYSLRVISRTGGSAWVRWLRSKALGKMQRIVEATPEKDISPAYCNDDGHEADGHFVLQFILWVGLYLAVGYCFTVRAVPAHPLAASLMREGIYLPRRLAEPTTLAKLIEGFRPPERYTNETNPSGTMRRAQQLQAHRLA